ncbi:MAG: GDP-mannose 4,6-dehydratase [Myxococcota bacterium]
MSSPIAGKNVIVTGACGFIGSHLVERLVRDGARVRGIVYYNSFGSHGWLEELDPSVKKEVEVLTGDIRDEAWVRSILKNQEIAFHLAALIAIPYSYVAPGAYVQTNVVGTLNVLSGARDAGVQRIVHTSTSEVYGTARYVPIDEAHVLQGQSPYSATKIAADKLVESFVKSFSMPIVTLRPFNTYGPRQTARAVIPTILTQLIAGKSTIKLGSVTPTRDFTFVTDTVDAFVRAGTTPGLEGEVLNAGNGKDISIGDLVKLASEVMGRRIEVVTDQERIRPANSEVDRLQANATRLREKTGWAPQVSLKEGLTRTAAWLKNPRTGFDADRYHV